jgi:hypothetical protein
VALLAVAQTLPDVAQTLPVKEQKQHPEKTKGENGFASDKPARSVAA